MKYLLPAIACAWLVGCGGLVPSDLPPGTPGATVIAKAGRPTRVVPLAGGGQRLQYSQQPVGRQSWNVDLDAAGKVVRIDQALTETNFERIQPGWTREDVEREFGPPAFVDRVASWDGPILNYRWRDHAYIDMWYWVYVDAGGIVRRAHPGVDYPLPGGDGKADVPSKD